MSEKKKEAKGQVRRKESSSKDGKAALLREKNDAPLAEGNYLVLGGGGEGGKWQRREGPGWGNLGFAVGKKGMGNGLAKRKGSGDVSPKQGKETRLFETRFIHAKGGEYRLPEHRAKRGYWT